MNIREEIYKVLGFSPVENRVKPGLLAEGTLSQIHEALARILIRHGIASSEAIAVRLLFFFSIDLYKIFCLLKIYFIDVF